MKMKYSLYVLRQVIFMILATVLLPRISFGQTDEDCLFCHEDNTLTAQRQGKTVSMFVNHKTLQNSVHKEVDFAMMCRTLNFKKASTDRR
jgi:hypothetical protein